MFGCIVSDYYDYIGYLTRNYCMVCFKFEFRERGGNGFGFQCEFASLERGIDLNWIVC